jgi:hypothetical protein
VTPELEKLQALMLHHAKNVMREYHEQWMPSSEHITQGLELFKPPMPGFEGYSVDDAIKRNDAFFRCRESWTVGPRHNFSVFVKHFQRWIPAKASDTSQRQGAGKVSDTSHSERCTDHPKERLVDGMCPVCYPVCAKCGQRHTPKETCDEFKQRMEGIHELFGVDGRLTHPDRRTGSMTTLAGAEVFDEKAKKEIKEIQQQEARQR